MWADQSERRVYKEQTLQDQSTVKSPPDFVIYNNNLENIVNYEMTKDTQFFLILMIVHI